MPQLHRASHSTAHSFRLGAVHIMEFVTTDTATVAQDRNGNYVVDIEIKEGTQVEHRYVVDKKNPDQRFLLKNTTADISTLDVVVQNSQTDLTVEEFKRADNLVELTGDSKVYFIDEVEDGLYEVTFGNGVLGKPILRMSGVSGNE